MGGTKQHVDQSTLRNENGALLEGDQIIRGFALKFERTSKISEEDDDNFDMANEIAVTNHLRTNQNRTTFGNRTDLKCNYNRGGDTKIHTHEIMNEIRKLKKQGT